MPERQPPEAARRPGSASPAGSRLAAIAPGLEPLVEDILGETSRIDLVAIDSSGRVHLLLFGEADQDAALLTRALAARAWVEARLPDWAKLAPERGIDTSQSVQAIAICPRFSAETRTAAAAIPGQQVRLQEADTTAAAPPAAPSEPIEVARPRVPASRPQATRTARPGHASRSLAPPLSAPRPVALAATRFRTGLSDADLGVEDT